MSGTKSIANANYVNVGTHLSRQEFVNQTDNGFAFRRLPLGSAAEPHLWIDWCYLLVYSDFALLFYLGLMRAG